MEIQLMKFGTTLVFRDRGLEAFTAFKPTLKNVAEGGSLVVDFTGVITFSPSWGDEFLIPLVGTYEDRLILRNTSNSSVQATLKILSETRKVKFNEEG